MSGIVSVLGARRQRSTNVRHEAVVSFDALVELFADHLVSYWKFQNTGTDEEGVSNATINGNPELNVPTLVLIDTIVEGAAVEGQVIAWPGTSAEYAEAAHNSAHKTSSGTIIVYFQRDSAVQKSQLIMADASGAAGGFAFGINANGSPDAYLRGASGVPVSLVGGPGDVELDRAYCFIFKWGGGGLELVLYDEDGLVRRVRNAGMTAGLTGLSAIRFGATHAGTNSHDGPYGRVIWLNRAITTDEEALFGARAKSVARSAAGYRALTLGMNPLALWGLGEPGGLTMFDAIGARNGSYTGTIAGYSQPDLPADSIDGSINFGATSAATVSHDSAFAVPAFTLSFWFRANIIPGEGQPALPLISKLQTVTTLCNLVIYIPSNGAELLRCRMHNGVANIDLDSPAGSIDIAGESHHVCLRADATGFDAFLDGIYLGKQTSHTSALLSNTAPWRFAESIDFVNRGNTLLDEITFFSRALTNTEILLLAQSAAVAPVADDDVASVPESATTAIDVLVNDTFVGTPSITIMSQPSGGDSVAVSGQQINYTAGAVAANTNRSFSYRITDPNGTSNTATVNVTVLNAGATPDPIANCFVLGAPDATVTSMAALQTAVNSAAPGDVIQIAAGTYAGGTLSFTAAGTAANPIVIRAPSRAVADRVTINAPIWTLSTASARLVFVNLFFNNPQITINGSHHRITRCQFRQVERFSTRIFAATDTRIDHCDWSDFGDNTTNKGCMVLDSPSIGNGSLRRVLFDYNYIHDINAPADTTNGSNYIRTNSSSNNWRINPGMVIDHCLFQNSVYGNHGEFIVTKVSGAKIRFCTFNNISGYLQQRQGGGWEVRSCWFEGMNRQACLMCWDDYEAGELSGAGRQLVIGNRLVGSHQIWIGAGNENGIETVAGLPTPGPYHRSRLGQFVGNIAGGGIRVGEMWSNQTNLHAALNNNVFGNTGTVTNINQQGTTTQNPATTAQSDPPTNSSVDPWYTFTPAEKLIPSQVGLGAPDPLCPSGPQN